MEAIIEKYFGTIYTFIDNNIGDEIPKEVTERLFNLIERAENRLVLEIELREFVCEKLSKV
jgi:hypothetical protein